MSKWLCEQVQKNCAELLKTIAETQEISKQFRAMIGLEPYHKPKDTEDSMAMSFRDAFSATNRGRVLVTEVNEEKSKRRNESEAIAHRIRTLKELVHQTFVELPKSMHRAVRFDVYQNSKERVRELGMQGGAEYDAAVRALQFTYESKRAYREAIESVVPNEHNSADYESSDGYRRY